jgi:hypothetical protein
MTFKSSIGWGGSRPIRAHAITEGGGNHSAQKTGNQGAQTPGPKLKKLHCENIVGGMRGGTDGKVALKPIPEAEAYINEIVDIVRN